MKVTAPQSLVPDRLLQLLRCPHCGQTLVTDQSDVRCAGCAASFPVNDGIVRFVDAPEDAVAARTQASFGYEWTHFNDWQPSGEENFRDYFEGADLRSLADAAVLDAGCGMGRHARFIADHARHLVAADFSEAIAQAAQNTRDRANIDCIQADLTALPFADATFDYAYSIGVLHHLADTPAALRAVVRKVKVGGRIRIYLYWNRRGVAGVLLQAVRAVRQVSTRTPFPLLRAGCWALSVLMTVAIVWPYRLLKRLGIRAHANWPLVLYTKYPFRVLYNDQFDRFSAPIEQRFDRDQVVNLLGAAGVSNVHIYPRFGWVAEGVRIR